MFYSCFDCRRQIFGSCVQPARLRVLESRPTGLRGGKLVGEGHEPLTIIRSLRSDVSLGLLTLSVDHTYPDVVSGASVP